MPPFLLDITLDCQVWVGLAVLQPISFKPQTEQPCQFISHSQPRQGGGLDFQKSKQIVVNRDHHFLSLSK